MKKKLLFVVTQFYKGGAEVALKNLFDVLSPEENEIDLLVLDQIPMKDARSLLPLLPSWVRVCDAADGEGCIAIGKKLCYKLVQKVALRQMSRQRARAFVQEKEYDAAFSYGEWLSPEFVAKNVRAKKKFIWIHADIDKARYVNEKILFSFDRYYNNYIFVSKRSKEEAEKKYPILRGKSVIVHNLCAEEEIRFKAGRTVNRQYKKPVLLSVGNLREEKNYPRQLAVMRLLKRRGISVTWLCIGSTANLFLYRKLIRLVKNYGLEKEFNFLGAKENPYCYMAMADAVMVLSDYESWSMVITEAKIIGTPVIATPTSGAMEQIEDKVNGRIVPSFRAEQIADVVQEYLSDCKMQMKIRENLEGFCLKQRAQKEFQALFTQKGEEKSEKNPVSV